MNIVRVSSTVMGQFQVPDERPNLWSASGTCTDRLPRAFLPLVSHKVKSLSRGNGSVIMLLHMPGLEPALTSSLQAGLGRVYALQLADRLFRNASPWPGLVTTMQPLI